MNVNFLCSAIGLPGGNDKSNNRKHRQSNDKQSWMRHKYVLAVFKKCTPHFLSFGFWNDCVVERKHIRWMWQRQCANAMPNALQQHPHIWRLQDALNYNSFLQWLHCTDWMKLFVSSAVSATNRAQDDFTSKSFR